LASMWCANSSQGRRWRPARPRSGNASTICAPLWRWCGQRFPPVYARALATLEQARQRIATADLLIATAALVDAAPLVARNTRDFARVPGLDLVGY
jgi:hypothetical protein